MMINRQSILFIHLAIIFISSHVFSAEFHVDNTPFQIVEDNKYVKIFLSSDKDTYNPCEPIILSITATNISDSTMVFLMPPGFREDNFTYSLYNNSENKKSDVTEYGRLLYQGRLPQGISGHLLKFKPNDTYTKKFQINRIYDISVSGDYIISASFACFDLASKTESHPKSNSIQIKITDEDPPILNDSDTVVPFTLKVGTEMDTSPQGIKEETGTVQKP